MAEEKTRKVDLEKPTKKEIDKNIYIRIQKKKLAIPKDELELHRGIHKAVYNKIAPWIERVLNGK